MTTNQTAPEWTPPGPDDLCHDCQVDKRFYQCYCHIRVPQAMRKAWLEGSWDIHGDTGPGDLVCTQCLQPGHSVADCPVLRRQRTGR